MITNGGLDVIINNMKGNSYLINYIAISDNTNNTISLDDNQLYNEVFRKQITDIQRAGDSIIVNAFIDINEANVVWKEIGLFANASSTPNSGILVAKAIINEEKTNLKTSNIIWEIKFERS